MPRLTLAHARTIGDAALAEAVRVSAKPLCVTILDSGGHVLVTLRDERASLFRADIAGAKAMSVLGMGFGGRTLAARAQQSPAFFAALTVVTGGQIVPVPGGVLIRDAHGEIVGSAGISGDTSDVDEACAVAGIAAAGLIADTGEAAAKDKS